jgi:hypothetical protein
MTDASDTADLVRPKNFAESELGNVGGNALSADYPNCMFIDYPSDEWGAKRQYKDANVLTNIQTR